MPLTRKNKIRFLERKNQVLEENYHLLTDLYQKNERLYHDMNHHLQLSLFHISEPTRLLSISYAVFCLKKKRTVSRRFLS